MVSRIPKTSFHRGGAYPPRSFLGLKFNPNARLLGKRSCNVFVRRILCRTRIVSIFLSDRSPQPAICEDFARNDYRRGGGGGVPGMYKECRFVKPNGLKCGSPALRGSPFCYFHARNRVYVPRRLNTGEKVFAVPPLVTPTAFTRRSAPSFRHSPAVRSILSAAASCSTRFRSPRRISKPCPRWHRTLHRSVRPPAPDPWTPIHENGELRTVSCSLFPVPLVSRSLGPCRGPHRMISFRWGGLVPVSYGLTIIFPTPSRY